MGRQEGPLRRRRLAYGGWKRGSGRVQDVVRDHGFYRSTVCAGQNQRIVDTEVQPRICAMRLSSEGTKVEKYQMGIAEQEATRRLSEGQAEAKVILAKAESKALNLIQETIASDNASQSEYLITEKYLDFFNKVLGNSSSSQKHVYLPYVAEKIMGIVGKLPKTYGVASSKARSRKAPRRAGKGDDFDE